MTDRSVLVRIKADPSAFIAGTQAAKAAVKDLHNEIDKSSDRTAWLAQGILALTPAVTRLGAGAVPVISGMATQLTVAAAAAGVAALAFNGVGDALTALNKYQLDPTGENLEKLNQALDKIGPEGKEFVEFLDSLGPALSGLSNTAREGMFPGVIDGITELMTLAPQVERIIAGISSGLGQLAGEAGSGLSGAAFEDFFNYLETDAKPILIDMGRTIGNFAAGLADMLVAFGPMSADFSGGLLEMSRSFAAWSDGLASSQGFQEFVDYVRDAGPQALDFVGALIDALVSLVEAAAPVGAVMLPALTAILRVISDLAATPLGPLVLGFLSLTAAWGRLNAIAEITGAGVMGRATAGIRGNVAAARTAIPTFRELGSAMAFSMHSQETLIGSMVSGSKVARDTAGSALMARDNVQKFGKAAAPVAGQVALLALAMSDYDDKLGITNTTTLALAGSMAGPWGAAAGAVIGGLMDLEDKAGAAEDAMKAFNLALAAGDQTAAAAAIDDLQDKLDKLKGTDLSSLTFSSFGNLVHGTSVADEIDEVTAALAKAKVGMDDMSNADEVVRAYEVTTTSIEEQTAALTDNTAAMQEQRAEALRGLNAELDYKASILDARDAIKENGRSVNENTRAGQANLQALYGLAGAWNGQSEAIKGNVKQLRAARQNFIDTAEKMGMSEGKARDLARALFEIPSRVTTEYTLEADLAMAHARAIKAELASIDRTVDIYINVHKPNNSGFGAQIGSADGSTVPDSGKGYADRFLYLLADREEVISNRHRQADKFRPVLKAINANMPPPVIKGMLADGGTTGGKRKFGFEPDPGETEAQRARRERREEIQAQKEEDRLGREKFLQDKEEERIAAWKAQEEDIANRQQAVLDGQEKAVNQLMDAAKAQQDAAQAVADSWSQAMERTGAAATADFRNNLFSGGGQQHGLWTGGTGGGGGSSWRDVLTGDINGLNERSGLITQLTGAGLTGTALEALLGQGSNEQIQAMLQGGEIGEFARLFAQREAAQAAVSAQAGQGAYGAQYAAAMSQVAALSAQMLAFQAELAAITAQRPITVYEAISAQATAAEVARLMATAGGF